MQTTIDLAVYKVPEPAFPDIRLRNPIMASLEVVCIQIIGLHGKRV